MALYDNFNCTLALQRILFHFPWMACLNLIETTRWHPLQVAPQGTCHSLNMPLLLSWVMFAMVLKLLEVEQIA